MLKILRKYHDFLIGMNNQDNNLEDKARGSARNCLKDPHQNGDHIAGSLPYENHLCKELKPLCFSLLSGEAII